MRPSDYPYNLSVDKYEVMRMFPFSVNPMLSEEAQGDVVFWLRVGLIWMYNFHHEESIACFQRALVLDPTCVMAHWGISCSNGPNYNAPCMNRDCFPSAADAWSYAVKAQNLAIQPEIRGNLSPLEIALVKALQCRFNELGPDVGPHVDQNTAAYAAAIKEVFNQYGSEPCVACAYAEALLNFNPWKLWDLDSGAPCDYTLEVKSVLEAAMATAPDHPGLNHFYVHLMEMSTEPEAALPACSSLRTVCPDAGHLVHMPSHIYVLLGMWQEAVDSNEEGHRADEIYRKLEGIYNSYTGYRLHNIHFICYAAMFAGQFAVAMRSAHRLQSNLPESLVSDPILGPFFEAFHSIDMHVLIRFGQWSEIFDTPIPTNPKIWPYRTATVRYARGIAHAITGNVSEARKELNQLIIATSQVPVGYTLHNNTCVDMLQVANAMLVGEIEYRAGNMDLAFESLRQAVSLSDRLNYDEPWGWMQPPRHALAALLLEQGNIEEAEATFRKDMDKSFYGRCHPDNIWALTGLAACLKLKLERIEANEIHTELLDIESKLTVLRKQADTNVTVACMCAGHANSERLVEMRPNAKKHKVCCASASKMS